MTKDATIVMQTKVIQTRALPLRLLLVLLAITPLLGAEAGQWRFNDVPRVVAVSDIHGAYDAMLRTFSQAGLIDESLAWSAGGTHLVITGDLLDRGPDSRKVMDLIMRLEGEAAAAGGQVHQLVGNHEVMNLVGDLRYVSAREYAAFAADESEDERERWFQRYLARQGDDASEIDARKAFNEIAPAGYFGLRRALRADGVYGKWLLDKPLLIVINDTAFVHGGLPSYVAEHGLQGTNDSMRAEVSEFVMAMNQLEDAGVLLPTDGYRDQARVLRKMSDNSSFEGDIGRAADSVIRLTEAAIHDSAQSPLWYRGTVGCSALSEGDVVDAALAKIGASRVVIGHSPTITRRVLQRMQGRVIEIDTGMLKSSYKGSGNALQIEDGVLTVINESGERTSPPVQHPREVGDRPDNIDANALAEFLRSGTLGVAQKEADGRNLLSVTQGELTLQAYFDPLPRKKGFVPELAAYRVDRLLGLDLVPVTVLREVDGVPGTLQFAPASRKSEVERAAAGQGGSAWCALPEQWNTMYVFDVLIYNAGRDPNYMQYNPSDWRLFVVEHDKTFGTPKGKPDYLKSVNIRVGNSWKTALQGLTDEVLKNELGDILDKRSLAALAKRRDMLINYGEKHRRRSAR